jgi:hypothetical protein
MDMYWGELVATVCVKHLVLRAVDKKRVTPSNENGHVGPAGDAERHAASEASQEFGLTLRNARGRLLHLYSLEMAMNTSEGIVQKAIPTAACPNQ